MADFVRPLPKQLNLYNDGPYLANVQKKIDAYNQEIAAYMRATDEEYNEASWIFEKFQAGSSSAEDLEDTLSRFDYYIIRQAFPLHYLATASRRRYVAPTGIPALDEFLDLGAQKPEAQELPNLIARLTSDLTDPRNSADMVKYGVRPLLNHVLQKRDDLNELFAALTPADERKYVTFVIPNYFARRADEIKAELLSAAVGKAFAESGTIGPIQSFSDIIDEEGQLIVAPYNEKVREYNNNAVKLARIIRDILLTGQAYADYGVEGELLKATNKQLFGELVGLRKSTLAELARQNEWELSQEAAGSRRRSAVGLQRQLLQERRTARRNGEADMEI